MKNPSDDVFESYEQAEVDIPFPLMADEAEAMLSDRETFDYENRRRNFGKWLIREGKDPDEFVGYSVDTAKRTMYRTCVFERWVWRQEDEYTMFPTHDHADGFMQVIAAADRSATHKNKHMHSLKRYFRWRHHEFGHEVWDTDRTFSRKGSATPQDYLTLEERRALRQAALDYGTTPAYKTVKCKEERRERLKPYVAEQTGVPIDDQPAQAWRDNEVESWRYTSLVWTSLDTGLRPSEVGDATVRWLDTDNALLRIPKEDASKNFENWEVSIREDTAKALDRWLYERSHYPAYDDNGTVWLTNKGNAFESRSLRRLLLRLCDKAGIRHENRKMSWYSIRHSVGTYMTREEDLAATKAQLRHKSAETTMKYDAAPPSDRRDALDKM